MKKVLMFQDYFYFGGIEKVILDISNNIGDDYKIDILSFVNKSNHEVTALLNKKYRSFFVRNVLGLISFKKYLKRCDHDIMHIHAYNSFGLIYAFLSRKYFKKIIVHAHSSGIDDDILYIKHIINFLIKSFFKSKKYTYLAVSKEANKFCFNYEKTIILPNGLKYSDYLFDEKMREYYRDLFKIKQDEIVIGHIGRFERQKNHRFIIDIFCDIILLDDKYKLFFVGEGLLKESIQKEVVKMGLEKKVIFLNNRDDILKLINMFDIYLFPSIYEGFGLTAIENQANGKYVFVSDACPTDIAISNRIKFLSLENSSLEWAQEIVNLKKVKLKLNDNLDVKNLIEKLKKIYEL